MMKKPNMNKGQSFPDTTEHRTTPFLTRQYHTSQAQGSHALQRSHSSCSPYCGSSECHHSLDLLKSNPFSSTLWTPNAESLGTHCWANRQSIWGGTFCHTKSQKDIFFKTRGPTINSLYKYVFMVHQRRHLCKLTGLTNYGTAGNPNKNIVLCINAAQKDTEHGASSWWPTTTKTQKPTEHKLKNFNTTTWGVKQNQLTAGSKNT